MRKSWKWLIVLAATIGIGLWLAHSIDKPGFTVSSFPVGLYTTDEWSCYSVCITNESTFAFRLDGVQYEWFEKDGKFRSAAAFSGWGYTLKAGKSATTSFVVPRDTPRYRISVVGSPGSPRKAFFQLIETLPLKKYPRINSWLSRFSPPVSVSQFASTWMTNNCLPTTATGPAHEKN
jgi:hypothetical protein